MSVNTSNDKIDFLPILEIIRRRYLVLLAFTAAGLLCAYIFSKVVTPLFESSVVMYPSNSNSRDKQLEDFSFGHEVQAERLMQLLSSNILLDSLEARFQMAAHYGFDKSQPDWYDNLLEMTHDRISISKNKYVSVGISVVDADPEFCASVANESARLVNVINADIVRAAAKSTLDVVEKEYQRRLSQVNSMNDSIVGIENQTANATKSKLQQQVGDHQRRIQVLSDSLDRLRRQYSVFDFGYQINVLNEHLADARANYLQEQGVLEVLEKGSQMPDTLIQSHRSKLNGAKLRMDNFTTELNRLSTINMRYTVLETQLTMARNLQLAANEGLQEYQMMVDPNLESRRINRLETDYQWDQLQTQELRAKYQKALSNYLDPVAAAIIVSAGKVSHKKIYPHTLVNLALGLFGGFFFGLLLLAFLDRRRGGVA
jgi:capsular polysaccharide biosynthesis protein